MREANTDKFRVAFEAHQYVTGWFDPNAEPQGHVAKGILVVASNMPDCPTLGLSVGEHWKDGERFNHPIHIFFDISQLCHNHRATWTASAWHGTCKHMRCQCHSTNVMRMGQHSVLAPENEIFISSSAINSIGKDDQCHAARHGIQPSVQGSSEITL